MGSGVEGFDFSHEGVKRVIGLLKGFVHAIASAPREFLYLSYLEINEHMIQKKKKKKKEKAPYFLARPLHLQSLKFQLYVVQCTIPSCPLTLPCLSGFASLIPHRQDRRPPHPPLFEELLQSSIKVVILPGPHGVPALHTRLCSGDPCKA